jgi:hypothetical protein
MVIGAAAAFCVSICHADGGCDAALMRQYRDCARIVGSLRPEKAGQARVFASDGSEFTAGQALWMQGQLRKVESVCASGDPNRAQVAAHVLSEVQELLKSHQRSS